MKILILISALLFAACSSGSKSTDYFQGRYTGTLVGNGSSTASFLDVIDGARTDLAIDMGSGCVLDIAEDETSPEPHRYLFSQTRPIEVCTIESVVYEIDLLNGVLDSDHLSFQSHWSLTNGQNFLVSFAGDR